MLKKKVNQRVCNLSAYKNIKFFKKQDSKNNQNNFIDFIKSL